MNAVRAECEPRRNIPVSEAERGDARWGELRSDVHHLQSDVTEIKADLRVTNQRINSMSQRVDDRFESMLKEITAIKDSLASAKVWAIGLYVTLAGTMLYVMAHGFKWL